MSSLVGISRRVSYVRGLISEFASLPLMHPPVSDLVDSSHLCCVLYPINFSLLRREATVPHILARNLG